MPVVGNPKGEEMAPVSGPLLTTKPSSAETGVASPWVKVADVGDWPMAMRA